MDAAVDGSGRHSASLLSGYVRLAACTVMLSLLLSCVDFFAPPNPTGGPIVVITFDDAHPSIYSIAFPAMRSLDTTWAATHFFPVSYMGFPGNMTLDQVKEMEKAGWETGGHAVTHENLSSVPIDSVRRQVSESYEFLVHNNLCHESFAYPFGNYSDTVRNIVSKYFKNIRTSHDYEYLDGVNREELGYYAVKSGCTADDIIGRVEKAKTNGAPLVIIGFHAIQPDTAPPLPVYWCKESAFMDFLRYLKKSELLVMTLKEAVRVLCE
jgi:peptidoglycan/xylan/chitin deacetylase (PgdA/CDA1 family)